MGGRVPCTAMCQQLRMEDASKDAAAAREMCICPGCAYIRTTVAVNVNVTSWIVSCDFNLNIEVKLEHGSGYSI